MKKNAQLELDRMEDRQVRIAVDQIDDNLVAFVQALARVAVVREMDRAEQKAAA